MVHLIEEVMYGFPNKMAPLSRNQLLRTVLEIKRDCVCSWARKLIDNIYCSGVSARIEVLFRIHRTY